MRDGDIQIFKGSEVASILAGRELDLIQVVSRAYVAHACGDISAYAPGTIILHVSLRDLTPEVILACDNVVDDIDHVCRAQTSIHMTENLVGNRDFIRCTLADILRGTAKARMNPDQIVVFSPFGMGILDIAVGMLVRDLGLEQERGTIINSFLSDAWSDEKERAAPRMQNQT